MAEAGLDVLILAPSAFPAGFSGFFSLLPFSPPPPQDPLSSLAQTDLELSEDPDGLNLKRDLRVSAS